MPADHSRPPRTQRLDTYVEDELYEWVHRQAAAQHRSASSWLRHILLQVREGLHSGAQATTLEGSHGKEVQ